MDELAISIKHTCALWLCWLFNNMLLTTPTFVTYFLYNICSGDRKEENMDKQTKKGKKPFKNCRPAFQIKHVLT